MSDKESQSQYVSNATAAAIQIALIALLGWWCVTLLLPFIGLVVWAAIIAIALYPLHQKMSSAMGGREKTAATLIVIIGLIFLITPTWALMESTISSVQNIYSQVSSGELKIPPPNDSVATWPLVGEKVYSIWSEAASDLEKIINQFQPQLRSAAQTLISAVSGALLGVLGFVFSLILAGVFLVSAKACQSAFRAIGTRLAGSMGASFADKSVATVRSVAKGVLGVALIQAFLAAIGLLVMDVPAAGIWAGLVLILAVVQLPPILVLGPIAMWVFSTAEAVPATIFLVYCLLVSFSDAALKPMLLGRGVSVPTLVILLGAIGGMISSGVIGLFTGAVVLSLGYELLLSWLEMRSDSATQET